MRVQGSAALGSRVQAIIWGLPFFWGAFGSFAIGGVACLEFGGEGGVLDWLGRTKARRQDQYGSLELKSDVEFGCVYASDSICAYRMEAELGQNPSCPGSLASACSGFSMWWILHQATRQGLMFRV